MMFSSPLPEWQSACLYESGISFQKNYYAVGIYSVVLVVDILNFPEVKSLP